MFSGIVTHIGKVKKITKTKSNCTIEINSKINFKKSEIGSSISCSGVCLTLEYFKKNISKFYLSKETIKKSTFKKVKVNSLINLEKSLKFGSSISGHFVQGHVDTTCKIVSIRVIGKSWLVGFSLPKVLKNNIVEKGSISINGVSLTIAKVLNFGFQISIIPHTLNSTNLKFLNVKDYVNIEFDILGKYIKNYIK